MTRLEHLVTLLPLPPKWYVHLHQFFWKDNSKKKVFSVWLDQQVSCCVWSTSEGSVCQFVFVVNNLLQKYTHVFTDCLCTSAMDFKPSHLAICFTTTLVSYMCCLPTVISGLSFIAMHEHARCICPNSGKSCVAQASLWTVFLYEILVCVDAFSRLSRWLLQTYL